MNAALLIQAIVRQTVVLIAALATSSGQRAQLASLSNQVFADLVNELREHGLGNKVIADMFGMALRTYHRKLARLSSSRTVQGKSLWEAVLAHIQQTGPVLRSDVLRRFQGDDEPTLRAVLLDLIEAGLVQREGRDDATKLSAVEQQSEPIPSMPAARTLEAMLLVALHRRGPIDLAGLLQLVPCEAAELETTLEALNAAGLVKQEKRAGQTLFSCETCVISFGDEAGWEAAVFDHYQALVVAIATKLRLGKRRADLTDHIGGSTFAFDIWHGHPLQAQVLGYLKAMREQGMQLRVAVEQHNAASPLPEGATPMRVTAYVGQSVEETEGDEYA